MVDADNLSQVQNADNLDLHVDFPDKLVVVVVAEVEFLDDLQELILGDLQELILSDLQELILGEEVLDKMSSDVEVLDKMVFVGFPVEEARDKMVMGDFPVEEALDKMVMGDFPVEEALDKMVMGDFPVEEALNKMIESAFQEAAVAKVVHILIVFATVVVNYNFHVSEELVLMINDTNQKILFLYLFHTIVQTFVIVFFHYNHPFYIYIYIYI